MLIISTCSLTLPRLSENSEDAVLGRDSKTKATFQKSSLKSRPVVDEEDKREDDEADGWQEGDVGDVEAVFDVSDCCLSPTS